jgi:outer membrane protease
MTIRIAPLFTASAILFAALNPTACAVHASSAQPGLVVSNGAWSLSVQGGIGIARGEAREVVYDADEAGGEFKLSELTWDIKDVVMAGGSVAAQIGPRYQISVGYWLAVTEGNGTMDNYDWLFGPDTEWSDWSLSDVEIHDSYAFDVNVAAEFYRRDRVGLSALLGYRQDQWSWKDQARQFIYSEFDFRDTQGYLDGEPSITYEQQFRIPYAGVMATLNGAKASAAVYFHYSPFVEAEDFDYHILRETKFESAASGGDYYGTGVRVGYLLSPDISVALAAEWQIIPEMRGDTTLEDPAGTEFLEDSAGMANDWMMLSVSLGYAF